MIVHQKRSNIIQQKRIVVVVPRRSVLIYHIGMFTFLRNITPSKCRILASTYREAVAYTDITQSVLKVLGYSLLWAEIELIQTEP